MTSREWDAHKRLWCESCRYERKCPVKVMLDQDPEDAWAASMIRRMGHCSQHEAKAKR